MSSCFLIKGEGVVSFAEAEDKKLYVPLLGNILILQNWDLVEKVKVIGRPYLARHLLLPGFDINELPFRLVYEKKSYDLRNIKTGENNKII